MSNQYKQLSLNNFNLGHHNGDGDDDYGNGAGPEMSNDSFLNSIDLDNFNGTRERDTREREREWEILFSFKCIQI